MYVAKQLGHPLAVLLSTYAHLIAEYEDAERIDAEAEIRKARGKSGFGSGSDDGREPMLGPLCAPV